MDGKPQVEMRALMTQRLNSGAWVMRGDPFTCGAQEARDRAANGRAVRVEAPAAPKARGGKAAEAEG